MPVQQERILRIITAGLNYRELARHIDELVQNCNNLLESGISPIEAWNDFTTFYNKLYAENSATRTRDNNLLDTETAYFRKNRRNNQKKALYMQSVRDRQNPNRRRRIQYDAQPDLPAIEQMRLMYSEKPQPIQPAAPLISSTISPAQRAAVLADADRIFASEPDEHTIPEPPDNETYSGGMFKTPSPSKED